MKLFVLAFFWAAPLAAANGRVSSYPPLQLPVSPILVGSLHEPSHPLIPRLEFYAQEMLKAATLFDRSQGIDPRTQLRILTDQSAPMLDRLTGSALARMIVEPGLTQNLVEDVPALQGSPIARLPQTYLPSSPYRGSIGGDASVITRLADAAALDPAVAALFDGESKKATLERAGVSGSNLYVGGAKTPLTGWTNGSAMFAHPTIAGATIEVFEEKLAPDSDILRNLPEGETLMDKTAALGHAPRTLGRDVVFSKGFGPKPMRLVAIRESVYGRSLASIAMDGHISPEDRALVRRALLAYMKAGGWHLGLKPGHIVVGSTLMRPERRAYIVDSQPLRAHDAPPGLMGAFASEWLDKLEFDASAWRAKANSGLAGFKF